MISDLPKEGLKSEIREEGGRRGRRERERCGFDEDMFINQIRK